MRTIARRDFLHHLAGGASAFALAAELARAGQGAPEDHLAGLPPFSWERVPVYAHLGKTDDDFTARELEFLASRFDFVTIEKGQAVRKRGSTEEGIYEAARELKKLNPRMKVLFYWNTFINYPLYRALDRFKPEWRLKDKNGNEVLKAGRIPRPDLSLAEVRRWWSDVAAEAMTQAPLDGIFADALPQVLTPALPRLLGEGKARAVVEGLQEMLALTRKNMGPHKLVLANGIRAGDYRQILDWEGISGVMIEHFGHFTSASPENIRADLESLAMVAARKKFAVLKAWPGFSWLDSDMMQRPHEELARLARERMTFPLACFLVGARPYSYFCYSWGYRQDDGMLDAYPELQKQFGPPRGEATWKGLTATRQFAHASVWLDLAGKKAQIMWA